MNKRLIVPALLPLGALTFFLWPAPADLSALYLFPAPGSTLPQRLEGRRLDQPLDGNFTRIRLPDPARLQTQGLPVFTQALRTQLDPKKLSQPLIRFT